MQEPFAITREQARRIDRFATEELGVPSIVLMENAGRGVVDVLLAIHSTLAGAKEKPVAILCGKGNNAGDGFVMARHLAIRDVPATIVLLLPPAELGGDALINYSALKHAEVAVEDLSEVGLPALPGELQRCAGNAAWLIDAMLGTGAQGEPREPIATAIRWMNSQPARRLAVDVPSGLDCDAGLPANATVIADVTCTFVAAKTGYFTPTAEAYLGQVHVVSIGLTCAMIRRAIADP